MPYSWVDSIYSSIISYFTKVDDFDEPLPKLVHLLTRESWVPMGMKDMQQVWWFFHSFLWIYFLDHGSSSPLQCLWNRSSEAFSYDSFVTLPYRPSWHTWRLTSIGVNIWTVSLMWPFSFISLNVVVAPWPRNVAKGWSIWIRLFMDLGPFWSSTF